MKKLALLALTGCLLTTTVIAQEYENLKALYVDGKYDKLVDKAEQYTKKDKTTNDALPYLYMAKGLFKISQDERFKNLEQYKSAEVETLNYFLRYKKKDKGNVYRDIADPFLAEVKGQVYEESQNFYDSKNYKKANGLIKKILKIEPENIGSLIVLGLCEYGVKNKTEGKKNLEQGLKNLKELKSFDELSTEDKNMMKYAIMAYTDFLLEQKDFSGAKSAITLGYQYYKGEENKDYEEKYNKVVNG